MSRLKGADLGVSLPSGTLNYRGPWDSAGTYAANDVVVRNGVFYRATIANGVGIAAPLTGHSEGLAANGASSGTFTVPATANVGDIAYVILSGWSSGETLTIAGWTSTIGYVQVSGNSDGVWFAVYRKVLTAADIGATVNASWSFSDYVAYDCRTYAGAHDVASASATNTLTTPSVTPTAYPSTVVSCASVGASLNANTVDVVVTAPTGTSNFFTGVRLSSGSTKNHVAAGADEALASGSSTPRAFGATPLASISYIVGAVAVKPVTGFAAGLWAAIPALTETVNTVGSSGAAVTLPDADTATMHRVTLTANTTITLPTPGAGKSFTVGLVQDATGGRTVTWATPSGTIKWPGGTVPTITATANAIDVATFICLDGATWLGSAAQAFA